PWPLCLVLGGVGLLEVGVGQAVEMRHPIKISLTGLRVSDSSARPSNHRGELRMKPRALLQHLYKQGRDLFPMTHFKGADKVETEGTLSSVWDTHVGAEFAAKDADQAVATMTADAYVNLVPLMIGARGRDGVRDFYAKHFLP